MMELLLNDEALKHNYFTALEEVKCKIHNLLHSSHGTGMTFNFHYFQLPSA